MEILIFFVTMGIFANAPLCKLTLIFGSALSYWNSVTKKGLPGFYISTFDWILSSLILYNTRQVEQLLGPSKQFLFQSLTTIISGIIVYFLGSTPNLALWALSMVGPYYQLIPYSHVTSYGPLPFTNKWYVYAFALQMVFTNPIYLVAPLISLGVFNKVFLKLNSKLFYKIDDIWNKISGTTYKDQTFFNRNGRRFEQEARQTRYQQVPESPSEPSVDRAMLRHLMDMGFSEDLSRQALLRSNNQLEQALMILLSNNQS